MNNTDRSLTKRKAAEEICCECGESVALGSGSFVNRVKVFDDYATKVDRGCPYPLGEFICPTCESKIEPSA